MRETEMSYRKLEIPVRARRVALIDITVLDFMDLFYFIVSLYIVIKYVPLYKRVK